MNLNEEQIAEDTTPESNDAGDVYDRLMEGYDEDEPEAEPEAESEAESDRDEKGRFKPKAVEAEEPEEKPEAEEKPEKPEADDKADEPPSHVPQAVKQHWASIPAEAREAISAAQKDASVRLAQAGRNEQALRPILNEVQRAHKSFPELANMTPDQIARDVFEMANTRANLIKDPVGTLLKVAQQTGKIGELAARLGQKDAGGVEKIKLEQRIAELEARAAKAADPIQFKEIVDNALSERETNGLIAKFASAHEHWEAVEPLLPAFVQAIQQEGSHTSAEDVLSAAYDMALTAKGLRAKVADPATAPAKPNPQRTEAAIRAKSVNVASSSGRPKPLSEREAMASAYDAAMRK